MDKKLLQTTFREWKKEAKADYSITNVDRLGDCCSCVNWELCERYGEDSKGIFAKHWKYGMNGSGYGVEGVKELYIAHDITEDQADTFYKVFGKHYNILPEKYDPWKCFVLYEKHTDVWEVAYVRTDGGVVDEDGNPIPYSSTFLKYDRAERFAEEVMDADGCRLVSFKKVF